MNLVIKLTTITLCITLSSCGEKKKEDPAETKAKEQQANITHNSVRQDYLKTLAEMSDQLAKIKDIETAKSALPALTKLVFKIKMVKTDLEKLGPSTKDIDAKYAPKIRTTMTKIGQTMNHLKASNPKAYGIIEKAMITVMR